MFHIIAYPSIPSPISSNRLIQNMSKAQEDDLFGDSTSESENIAKPHKPKNKATVLSSDDEDHLKHHKSSNIREVDDLLGSDSDSYDAKDNSNSKLVKNEVDELLGNSDSDSESDSVHHDHIDHPTDAKNDTDELDQILGRSTAVSQEQKLLEIRKTKIKIQQNYKVPNGNKVVFARTPNFIKFQPCEYNVNQHDSRAEKTKFDGATAIVRWRTKDQKKQSNSYFMKWDDGTYQLVVGDAVFNAKILPTENW